MATEQGDSAEQVSPQRELSRQSEALIRQLDQTNREAIQARRGRLGWQVGEDQRETFILSQPVDRDDPVVGPSGRTEISRTRYYVMFTRAGVRAIRFQKGVPPVDAMGRIDNLSGLDSGNERSERNLRQGLDNHVRDWEDNGQRLTSKRSGHGGSKIEYKYSGGNPGFIQEPSGREFFRLDRTDWGESQISGLISQVPENVVGQAYTESVKQSQRVNEVPATEAQRQLDIVNRLLADLTPPPPPPAAGGPK